MPILLMTRPEPASRRFVDGLAESVRDRTDVIVSPLIEIAPVAAEVDFAPVRGLVLTSANGVEAATRLGAPDGLPCFCVGSETTRRARAAGRPATLAGGTADELVSLLSAERPAAPLLHLGGRHRRGEIAGRLTAAGIPTRAVTVYDQVLRPFSGAAHRALAGSAPVVAPLFSPRTARQFAKLYAGRAPLYLAALSDAVAEPLKALDSNALQVCAAPDVKAMKVTVRHLLEMASRVETGSGPQ